jgi:hypothetical protein
MYVLNFVTVVGVPADHPTIGDPGLSLVEQQSHFSLWSMFASLMLATNDVRKRDKDVEKILLNPETIAISQDPWTIPAFRVATECAGEMWARHLANGDIAVLILNRGNSTIKSRIDWNIITNTSSRGVSFKVRDIQERTDLPVACGHASLEIALHATAFVRLTKQPSACTPTPPAECSAPAPYCTMHCCPSQGQYCPCGNIDKPCTFPVPPLPPCPTGFTNHSSGYWADPDQKTAAGHSKSVAECGSYCAAKPGCTAFEVYDPGQVTEPSSKGGSACYTFSNGLKNFLPDSRGLIRTCVKKN